MRKEIAFTIQNIQGVRVGLFTPDMAFEAITKNQIEKLLSPAVKCVDMVSAELMTAVKNCADGVRALTCSFEFLSTQKLGQSPCTIVQGHEPNFAKNEKLRILNFYIFS